MQNHLRPAFATSVADVVEHNEGAFGVWVSLMVREKFGLSPDHMACERKPKADKGV